jgi:TaqI-like C-terminal specificity domain/Eco57I restriction-modification methylase
VFVELGLKLLHRQGQLAYILPHKFFNAQYGEPLRRLLADGKHLRHVVHFGDQQVFPGATNYVCLLFLTKAASDHCCFIRADDLPAWLGEGKSDEASFEASRITPVEWNFAVGKGAGLFEKLQAMPFKLGQVASRISQGIRTSANEVYVLDVLKEKGGLITATSTQLEREVVVERERILRFLKGREIKAYSVTPSGKVVVMPYKLAGDRMTLLTSKEFRTQFPNTWNYLLANREYLEAREDGCMNHDGWFGFIYPKNLDVMFASKILVPDIADRAAFALDEQGEFAFTSGYAITLKPEVEFTQKYLLALLNSRLLDYFWKRISTPLRGGFYRYFTQFIEQLPVYPINFADKAEGAEHVTCTRLTSFCVEAGLPPVVEQGFGGGVPAHTLCGMPRRGRACPHARRSHPVADPWFIRAVYCPWNAFLLW